MYTAGVKIHETNHKKFSLISLEYISFSKIQIPLLYMGQWVVDFSCSERSGTVQIGGDLRECSSAYWATLTSRRPCGRFVSHPKTSHASIVR